MWSCEASGTARDWHHLAVVALDGSTRLCLAVVADCLLWFLFWWWLWLFAPSVAMLSCEASGTAKDHHHLVVVVSDGSTWLCLAVVADYTAVAAVVCCCVC